MNVNHLALVTAITIIAATAAYNPANAEDIKLKCTVVTAPHDTALSSPTWVADASKPYDAPVLMQGAQIHEAPSKGVTKVQVDTQPLDASADMTPHKDLTGTDLMVWNKFCKGQDPKKVFEWRYNRCHGLSSEFVR